VDGVLQEFESRGIALCLIHHDLLNLGFPLIQFLKAMIRFSLEGSLSFFLEWRTYATPVLESLEASRSQSRPQVTMALFGAVRIP
jgi:hypothetical protein